ncbi:MAG: hypothetical protein EA424_21590 [Planctomycetaceae bacterium]|nr:MAG: hypothetical protein EA424_21590 [Planctomycetaceae bacterium]
MLRRSTTHGWRKSIGVRTSSTPVASRPYRGLKSKSGLDKGKPRVIKPRFLPGATKDYEDAFDWYRARSERAAEEFEEAVERALADIVEAPDRWPGGTPTVLCIGSWMIPSWLRQSPTHVDGLATGSGDSSLADWTSGNPPLAELKDEAEQRPRKPRKTAAAKVPVPVFFPSLSYNCNP